MDRMLEFVDFFNEVIMLRAAARDARRVCFLKRIRANQMCRHLTGDAHDRNRIEQRIRQPCHRIGRTRPGSHQHHPDFTRRTGIAFGRMNRPLLMARQDVADMILLKQRIINRQHRATRVTKNDINPLILQGFYQYICTSHFTHRARIMPQLRLIHKGFFKEFRRSFASLAA